jgi:ribose/xylose/arabinose/galactoside ABC-type transport system permease subunit/ABC-type sugar transport system substrate-binding protein
VNSPLKLRLSPVAGLRGPSSLSSGERWLLAALIAESVLFSFVARGFFGWTNFFEVLRFSVELGLLSIALTPVIVTGGIDLSVGSLVGLTAVIIGVALRDFHLPIAGLLIVGLCVGCVCGALNAIFIAWLRLPPLIVTLGTFTLYRGIAEGITHGAVSYTGFPPAFLLIGQGYFFRVVPAQLPIFILVAIGYYILLHRSTIGRGLYAIGMNAPGAQYAGIPVRKRLILVYLLAGIVSSLAGIILVAHLGLSKSDLGTGYELEAITAVVLGGTSVFGGRGTLFGSLLGLFFLTVLQDGMHLLALPSELTGVLTGVLLLGIVSLDQLRRKSRTGPESQRGLPERTRAILSSRTGIASAAVILLFLIAAIAFGFVHHSRSAGTAVQLAKQTGAGRRLVIAVMPKAKGDPYFISARIGAEEAARELGVDLIWDGPTSLDASQQNELVENWITMGVDAIVVAVENSGSISTVLRKARQHGIAVLTWDADAQPDARDYFLDQATPEGIADALTDEAERLLPDGGQFAIITGALSAENQNEWIACIKRRLAARHSRLTLATVEPGDDDRDKAFTKTQTILKVLPQVKLIMDISAPAVPGSAEAVLQSGRPDVYVIGLSLPTICRPYIHSGTVQTIVLWNTHDLGYLTVYAGWLDAQHKIPKSSPFVIAGRLGKLTVRGSEIVLGTPLIINRANIDRINF